MYDLMRKWLPLPIANKLCTRYMLSEDLLPTADFRRRDRPEVRDLIEEYYPLLQYAIHRFGKMAKVRLANRYARHIDGWIGRGGKCLSVQITQGCENRQSAFTRLQMLQGGPVCPLAPKVKEGGIITDVGSGISDWKSIVSNWRSSILKSIHTKVKKGVFADILLVNAVTDCSPNYRFNKQAFLAEIVRELGSGGMGCRIEILLNDKYLGSV